jgi:hypothetical protein
MHWIRRFSLFGLALTLVGLLMTASSTRAGNLLLTNNSGNQNAMFFITGEPSLVMNGFDLQPLGIQRPVQLDRVNIDVVSPVPGQQAIAVVYQDADGGDPVNATLVGQQAVTINQSGVFSATFNPPLQITQPVVWAGFYLPVDFEFNADRSGTSVLTYWGWTPGSTFNLSNLASAEVFGPGNGSAPVNINMNGIARITAELITDPTANNVTITPVATNSPNVQNGTLLRPVFDSEGRIIQAVGDPNTSLLPLLVYPEETNCDDLYWDTDDIRVNYRFAVEVRCRLVPSQLTPKVPEGYELQGRTYDISIFGVQSPSTNRIPFPITHCLLIENDGRDDAVLGLSYGAPNEWEILPTVRFGNFVCANLNYAGVVAPFRPT